MNEIVDTVEDLLETEFGRRWRTTACGCPGSPARSRSPSTRRSSGPALYQQKIHVLSEMNKTIACSVDKARDELGYRPERRAAGGHAALDPAGASKTGRTI